MRIISGKYKGKKINPPKGLPVRPTTDQSKEALFNILGNMYDLDEVRVLDCFAGTGNISFEFVSRGAVKVVAVDRHAACVRFISDTFHALDASSCKAVRKDVIPFLKTCDEKFDIIFMDPPYRNPETGSAIRLCFENKLLTGIGTLVVEHSMDEDFSELPWCTDVRKYGGCVFSFFEEIAVE